MTYEDAISYIYSFVDYERLTSPSYDKKERSPARFVSFLRAIDSPQESFPVIHIAGTKGKGSVAMMLTYILREAGLVVGTYTSPHLTDVRERIMFDGHPIGRGNFLDLFLKILPQLEERKMEKTYRTVFEILTAISFLYFKREKVDIGIIEVGLGGRLDATNVFEKSIAVITNISLDHTKILRNTLEDIADEKSEIIKPDSLVVSSPQREGVLKVIREKALARNCRFLYTGNYECTIREKNEKGSVFDVKTDGNKYRGIKLSLPGRYQIENALTTIGVVEELKNSKMQICKHSNIQRFEDLNIGRLEEAVYRGLASVRWRGRLEVLRRSPYLVVDGAHNAYSAGVLAEEVTNIFEYERLVLIFGVNRDKDIRGMLNAVLPISDEVIFTRVDFPRSADPLTLVDMARGHSRAASRDIKEALAIAYGMATQRDLILITGSLYLVGEAIKVSSKE